MNKLISIVVPVYNVEDYLERCLNSIINQTYKELEIILVNDGSTDTSGQICDRYASMDDRITVIHKQNGGLSDARNCGIKKASGAYIGFIDSDDYINENMYDFLYRKIQENNADIAIGGTCKVYENGIYESKNKNEIIELIMNKKEALSILNSFSYFDVSVWDKLYKRELFNNIEFPVGKKCEDFYTLFKVFYNASKVIYNSTDLYYYYQRPNSISRNNDIDFSYIEASDYQLEYFKEHIKDMVSTAEIACVFSRIATYNKYLEYNRECPKEIKKHFKKYSRKKLIYVLKSKNVKNYKKVQAFVFSFSQLGYKLLYKVLKNV